MAYTYPGMVPAYFLWYPPKGIPEAVFLMHDFHLWNEIPGKKCLHYVKHSARLFLFVKDGMEDKIILGYFLSTSHSLLISMGDLPSLGL